MSRYKMFYAGLGVALTVGTGDALAQGFESHGQLPAEYSQEEAQAVATTVEHVRTTDVHDLGVHMALIDESVISRADPANQMGHGAQAYCASYGFLSRRPPGFFRLDELYVVGGPLDSVVLHKRTDINSPAGIGRYGGYPVEVAVLLRVNSEGLVSEWYDVPVNRIGSLTTQPANSTPPRTDFPDNCSEYSDSDGNTVAGGEQPEPMPPEEEIADAGRTDPEAERPPILSYGTVKPESWWNVEETEAAQAVRAWYAAWQAADPLLLAPFVADHVTFRTEPTGEVQMGRDTLLESVCGIMGGDLTLAELYPIGADWSTMVLTEAVGEDGTRTAGLFRVQDGLIVEWTDFVVEGDDSPAEPDLGSAACTEVTTALAE